ncbi:hypothetical protein [Roseateles sp. LKC17W]|uniref:SecA family profile domain-containing protein n=1 Tax=Pelomonas margarita TaxID=3299031 RepID=A0ABW7FJY1_9BURK
MASDTALAPPWCPPLERPAPRGLAPREADRAAAVAALRAAVDAALPHVFDAPASLRAAGLALRRALNREDGAAERIALAQGLAAAQHAWQFDTAVLDAACALVQQGAVTLPRAADRHRALALAAAAWAASGRPCLLMTADDEAAAQACRLLLPLFEALGVDAAPAGSDASGSALRRAYAAGVVIVPARRLAADLARDRRERGSGDAQRLEARLHGDTGAGLLVTRGLFALLVDELDRVLFDDAVNPVLLSVPDDSTALGEALQQACSAADALAAPAHYTLSTERGLQWTPEGAAQATRLLATLPPLWRPAERGEWLLRQALAVRDLLQPGRDYTVAGPQVHLDDAISQRLPERALLPHLTQAIQARAGLAISPVTRATDRTSVLGLAASAHRLGGAGASLQGLAPALWRQHGLLAQPSHTGNAATLSTTHEASLDDTAWQARVQAGFDAPAGVHRLFVLRQLASAARFADLPGAKAEAWVLAGLGPQRALTQRQQADDAEGRPPATRIEVLFIEPLDSARAEQQFIARVQDAAPPGAEVQARLLLHPQGRWVDQALGPLADALRTLCRLWPARTARLLAVTLALLRWQSGRQQARALQAQAQREHQLKLQLSFAGGTAVVSTTPPAPSPASASPRRTS